MITSTISNRQKKVNLLKYVIGSVLDEDDDGILNLTLNHLGIKCLFDILYLRIEDIEDWSYIDPTDNKEKTTPKHLLAKFHAISRWNLHLQVTLHIGAIGWEDLSTEKHMRNIQQNTIQMLL